MSPLSTLRSAAAVSCLVLTGCGSPALPPLSPAPVDVQLAVGSATIDSGAEVDISVTVYTSAGWSVAPGELQVSEGLDVTPGPVDGPAQVGDRQQTIHHFTATGPDGSYVIAMAPVDAAGPADQTRTLEPPPVFVDIGVNTFATDQLAELSAPPPPSSGPPWVWIAGGTLAGIGLLTGAVVLYRRRRAAPAPPRPAHVRAREAWAAARAEGLDDHALAVELSRILREFLQDVTGYPATARTTREILQHAEHDNLLGSALRLRAAAVLDATDRLKFAREGGGDGFFERLTLDFEAVVTALAQPSPPGASDA